MPGAYAHITAVNEAAGSIEDDPDLPVEGKIIIGKWLRFCELGAVSPDYPYLHPELHSSSTKWADAMHWHRTGDRIARGIERLAAMPKSDSRDRCLAWLLGFTAHVIMDVTLHPVVNLKVGPYEENKAAHRRCEMNQDTYIFETRMNLGLQYADHLEHGIMRCSNPMAPDMIDPDVFDLWTDMFQTTDKEQFGSNPPNIDAWHDWFEDGVRSIAGNQLVALARHVAPGALGSLAYPLFKDIDYQYIRALEVPSGGQMDYDVIFDKGVDNVIRAWTVAASDVLQGSSLAKGYLRNWNLDTGEDEAKVKTFWS